MKYLFKLFVLCAVLCSSSMQMQAAAAGRFDGKRFLRAAEEGNIEEVRRQLKSIGANVNFATNRFVGETALILAACEGHTEIVKLLIDAGAYVDIYAHYWKDRTLVEGTALDCAARRGHTEIVKLLIDKRAKLKNMDGRTDALMHAAREGHTEIVEELIDAGADVKSSNDSDGGTALMRAAQAGHTKIVKLLIDAGADVNYKIIYDYNKEIANSPMISAISGGKDDIIKELLAAGAAAVGEDKASAIEQATSRGRTDYARLIEEFKPATRYVKPARRSAAVEPSGPAASGEGPTGAAGKQEKE